MSEKQQEAERLKRWVDMLLYRSRILGEGHIVLVEMQARLKELEGESR